MRSDSAWHLACEGSARSGSVDTDSSAFLLDFAQGPGQLLGKLCATLASKKRRPTSKHGKRGTPNSQLAKRSIWVKVDGTSPTKFSLIRLST